MPIGGQLWCVRDQLEKRSLGKWMRRRFWLPPLRLLPHLFGRLHSACSNHWPAPIWGAELRQRRLVGTECSCSEALDRPGDGGIRKCHSSKRSTYVVVEICAGNCIQKLVLTRKKNCEDDIDCGVYFILILR